MANDLIEDMETAKEMKQALDKEYKLGDKEYDLEHVAQLFEECNLDINLNPSVYFTTLTKINKKFEKFNETGGKDYRKDDRELFIKI